MNHSKKLEDIAVARYKLAQAINDGHIAATHPELRDQLLSYVMLLEKEIMTLKKKTKEYIVLNENKHQPTGSRV